ncbi:MAG: DUF4863 family protein [Kiloniellales bacterium]|nr:DUF4863 family protein [Kiloniellales bacterium]
MMDPSEAGAEKRKALRDLLEPVMAEIAETEWNEALAARLNARFGPDGGLFRALEARCDEGIETGWMGLQGEEVRKGARVIEPGPETRGLSVDVVQLIDFTGPHHRHPKGEVCAVMTERPDGRFDGQPRGWAVYPPGSEHWPAGTGGRVRILFFLPDGKIEYTDREASLASGAKGGVG